MRVRSVVIASFYIVHLLLSLLAIWITLSWRIRKARGAFEKQLISQGMSRRDARRLSAFYDRLMRDIFSTLRKTSYRPPR
jgi:hypothetical protein